MSEREYAQQLVEGLQRSLGNRGIDDVVILTERDAETLYHIIVNWALDAPLYRSEEAKNAIKLLGFIPPHSFKGRP